MSIARPPLSRHAAATSASDCAIASPSAAIGAAWPGREQLADLRLDLGGDRDLGLQAQLLELAADLLQLELGLGARLLAGGLGAHLTSECASASTSALIWRSSFCLRWTAACAFVIATSPRARAAASACSASRVASDSATSAVRRISAMRWRPMLSR